jgi:hypothetical protein
MPYLSTLQTTADRFRVTLRTVSRWRSAGVDTDDLVSIAEYFLKIRNPSRAAMNVVRDRLIAELLQPQSITH